MNFRLNTRFKRRKKGAVFLLEFLGIIPLLLVLTLFFIQSLFFVMSQATVHQAAMDGARILTHELRGYNEIKFAGGQIPSDIQNGRAKDLVIGKMKRVTSFNNLILLFKEDETIIWNDPECKAKYTSDSYNNYICINLVSEDVEAGTNGKPIYQVYVRAKSKFKPMFNIPYITDKLMVRGSGVSHIENTDRFDYYAE